MNKITIKGIEPEEVFRSENIQALIQELDTYRSDGAAIKLSKASKVPFIWFFLGVLSASIIWLLL